jgi:hypothetical protein
MGLKEKLESAVGVAPDCGMSDVCGEDVCLACELLDGEHCQKCRSHEKETA